MKSIFYKLTFLWSSFFLFSCGLSSSSTKSVETNPHVAAHQKVHNELKQEEIQKAVNEKYLNENVGYQQILLKKNQEGIDFYALGNEPFWSLDMDFEKVFRFKNLDGLEFNAPPSKPVKAMDEAITRYRSVTESGEIIIQLNHTGCTDSMSGQKFDYSVSVDLKTVNETDYIDYKGCGNYVPDYRLYNIWAIVEVDGIKVNPANFKMEFPRIEINTTEGVVFGNDGCNSFNGSFKTEHHTIYFGNLASTMIACFENTAISSKIGKILSNNNLTYKYENNLIFYDHGKKVMELKNID